jgi:hypothetical protein
MRSKPPLRSLLPGMATMPWSTKFICRERPVCWLRCLDAGSMM